MRGGLEGQGHGGEATPRVPAKKTPKCGSVDSFAVWAGVILVICMVP